MAATIKVRIKACEGNNTNLTLSSTPEPNGGDHYVVIGWHPRMSVQLYVPESNTWVPAPGGFYFTSAGEHYLLRASGDDVLKKIPDLTFPYTVHAVYTPTWADVEDVVVPSLDEGECCPEGTPDGTPVTFYTLPTDNGCVGTCISGGMDNGGSKSLQMYTGAYLGHPEVACIAAPSEIIGAGGTKVWQFSINTGTWRFYENAVNLSGTYSPSSGIGSFSLNVTLTKPSNSYVCTLTATLSAVQATKTGPSGVPGTAGCNVPLLSSCGGGEQFENVTDQIFATWPLECSNLSLKLAASYSARHYFFPQIPNPIICCICKHDFGSGDTGVYGWVSYINASSITVKLG